MKVSEIFPVGSRGEVYRDGDVTGLSYLGHVPKSERELLFISSSKYLRKMVSREGVGAVITTQELADAFDDSIAVIIDDDPMELFFETHKFLIGNAKIYQAPFENQISDSAVIHPTAAIAEHSVIIGDNVVIEPNVVVHSYSKIGDRTVIRAGSVIGAEGFEYKRFGDALLSIPHGGGVSIGHDCEIQCLTVIDRALFGYDTTLGNHTKVDNLVHVAHGCVVGDRCLIVTGAVLGGAVIVEDDVRIDPNSSIAHETRVKQGAYVSMGAVVGSDVPEGSRVSGNLAVDHTQYLRTQIKVKKL